jgi:hypothetical protein
LSDQRSLQGGGAFLWRIETTAIGWTCSVVQLTFLHFDDVILRITVYKVKSKGKTAESAGTTLSFSAGDGGFHITGKVENMLLVIDGVVFPQNRAPASSSLQIKGHVILHTEPAQLAEPDHDLARDAPHTLLAYGLLTPRTLFSGLRMHPLIQQIVSAMLNQEQQKDLAQATLSACTRLQSTTNDFMQQICLASQLRQLAIQETTWVDANLDNAAAFVWAVSVYQELGMTQQTEPLLTSALNIYQRTPDHPLIGQIQSQLATLYAQLQQFALAETYAQQAVTSTAQAMGISHHQVLQYLNNLGQLYQQQEKKAEARACYEKTVSICEHTGQQQHQHCRDARTWWKQCQD